MTHSYSKLYYHLIWSTKNREPLIPTDFKNRLYGYIRAVTKDKKQRLDVINGMPDHVHLLVNLSTTLCVSDFIRHVKTTSTKWMIANSDVKSFSWQEGYAAYTVGHSNFKIVSDYINDQENHHQKISFDEEYIKLLRMQDISFDPRFVLG